MKTVNLSELRSQLTNYEVFFGETRILGHASIDLPDLKFKTATIAGAGITGDIEMATPGTTESLELTLNWRSIHSDLSEFSTQQAIDLVLYGSQHIYDQSKGSARAQQVKINVRGIPKNTPLGKFEPASITESKNTLEVLYLKVTVDNEVIFELDKLNYIYVVNGTDYLEDTRKALNIS